MTEAEAVPVLSGNLTALPEAPVSMTLKATLHGHYAARSTSAIAQSKNWVRR